MLHRNSKYHSNKIFMDGMKFDSKKEAERYLQLIAMQEEGEITDLQRQVKYLLIPSQKETIGKKTMVIERECAYYADFVYKDKEGRQIVEDVKGMLTPEYVMKRKMMLWVHGIKIKEYRG